MKISEELLNELEKLLAKSRKQRVQSSQLDVEIARIEALIAERHRSGPRAKPGVAAPSSKLPTANTGGTAARPKPGRDSATPSPPPPPRER